MGWGCSLLRFWKCSSHSKYSADHNALRKSASKASCQVVIESDPAMFLRHKVSDSQEVRCVFNWMVERCVSAGSCYHFLCDQMDEYCFFWSAVDQYAGRTCFLSILKGYCVTSMLILSSLMESQWCVESLSPLKLQWLGLSHSKKKHEVKPIILIFAATFNDTTHLATGLLLKHRFSPSL